MARIPSRCPGASLRACSGAILLLALTCCALGKEFSVSFKENKPLGIRFDNRLRVQGFGDGLAASSGWIKKGDVLVAVNGKRVEGMKLPAAARSIQSAPLPKVLTFDAAGKEDREQVIQKEQEEKRATAAAGGVLTVFQNGQAVKKYSFVKAAFGGPTKCKKGPLIIANPGTGCEAYKNAKLAMDAIVVVTRGVCSFTDKALLAEERSALGVVVINTMGPAIRMPLPPGSPPDVALPVVSIGDKDGKVVERMLKSDTLYEGQIMMNGEFCGAEAEDDVPVEEEEKGTAPAGELRIRFPTTQANANAAYAAAVKAAKARSEAELAGDIEVEELNFDVDEEGNILKVVGERAAPEMPEDPATAPYEPVDVVVEFVKAEFGAPFPTKPLRLVVADPPHACGDKLANAAAIAGSLVLVERGKCAFSKKVAQLHQAKAAAMIAVNSEAGLLAIPSAAVDSLPAEARMLPTVMIPRGSGLKLKGFGPIAVGMRMANSTIAKFAPFDLEAKLKSRSSVLERWSEVSKLDDWHQWPEDRNARKKLFLRLSKVHHPDKPTGSADRFASLKWYRDRADHVYHPGSFKHPGEFLG